MGATNRLPLPTCALLGSGLLIVLVVACPQDPPGPASPPKPLSGMERWDVFGLAQHLWDRGSVVRILTVDDQGSATNGAFLTTTGKGWAELNGLPKQAEAIGLWEGTVYCEKLHGGERDEQIEQWGDCCRQVGPFLLFGDRKLMAEVHSLCTR
jgi:hypothetical protein